MALKDKILGGLFGQALGDSWGMPAYFDIDLTWKAFGGWPGRSSITMRKSQVRATPRLRRVTFTNTHGWVLRGEKAWVTNGGTADVVLAMVRTDTPEARRGAKGISTFIVPTDPEKAAACH